MDYAAASVVYKETCWLKDLQWDIKCSQLKPTEVRCGYQNPIILFENPEFHRFTEHIGLEYHFIKNLQKKKKKNDVLTMTFIGIEDQLADLQFKGHDS